jgi:Flp pilus assembly protein TadG
MMAPVPNPEAAGAGTSERGSASVIELIILAPVFLMLCLLVIFCGRLINAQGVVNGAARDAARAASIERSAADAEAAADDSVATNLAGTAMTSCSSSSEWIENGQNSTVTVVVNCTMPMGDLALLKVPGTREIIAEQTAPVDFFRGS